MPLINCKISLDLTRSEDCAISSATGKTKFAKHIQNFMLLL